MFIKIYRCSLTNTRMHARLCVSVRACAHAHTEALRLTHTRTHTHTHTHTHDSRLMNKTGLTRTGHNAKADQKYKHTYCPHFDSSSDNYSVLFL